jgi:hypothetical protein
MDAVMRVERLPAYPPGYCGYRTPSPIHRLYTREGACRLVILGMACVPSRTGLRREPEGQEVNAEGARAEAC